MGRFVTIGAVEHPLIPYRWQPRTAPCRFIATPTAQSVEDAPTPIMEDMSAPIMEDAPTPIMEDMSAPIMEDAPTPIMEAVSIPIMEDVDEDVSETIEAPDTIVEALPIPAEEEAVEASEEAAATPLSLNLLNIRRRLALTPEEFARPIIDDGEGLINRLEAGFSRPSPEIARLICEAWSLNQKYLFTGTGPMFQMEKPGQNYARELVTLLKQYLQVATFDRRGNQYWKGSLVNDLMRLIDATRLTGSEAAMVIRVMYDYLDAEQFEELLERMGRL